MRLTLAWILLLMTALWSAAGHAAGQVGFGDFPEVEISAKLSGEAFTPGQRGFVVVVMDHGEELHSWPSAEQDVLSPELAEFAIRAEIGIVEALDLLDFGPVQWPEPKPAMVPDVSGAGGAVEALTYKGRALAFVPFVVSEDAPVGGSVEVPLEVSLQACDDTTCYMPQNETITLTLHITAEGDMRQKVDPDFDGFDASVFDRDWSKDAGGVDAGFAGGEEGALAAPASSGGGSKFLGFFSLPTPDSPWYWVALIGFSLAGGFVLNLTPCVLPVIPIKVMTLTKHAGEDKGRAFVLGLWMAIGVIAFWSALAIPVLFVQSLADPSRIFSYWWLTLGIGLLIVVMAGGLMGLFNITLPQKTYMINPKADNAWGSFLFGVMTAVLGLPCFGFIVGALLPAAATMTAGVVLAVFVSMGVGMALPYLVLSIFPGLLKNVPKTGPASELVKQVMGLLLMAAGAYFIGSGLIGLVAEKPYLAKVLHWWAAGILVFLAGLWLLVRTVQITKKPLPRVLFSVVAVGFGAAGVAVAMNMTQQARDARIWETYSPAAFSTAIASDRVVVLDFTAEWCLNCKALEAAVLNVDPVRSQLTSDAVVAMKADLTARSAPGWEKLFDLGQTGIPTLAIYGPGLEDGPWIANAYTSSQVLAAIEEARGAGDEERLTAR